MYADHLRSRRIDPIGLGGAAVIGGAILAALINVAPQIVRGIVPVLETYDVRPDPIPTPTPEPRHETKPKQPTKEDIYTPNNVIPSQPSNNVLETTREEPPAGTALLIGKAEPEPFPVAPPPPPLIAADIDPRYADDFQPPYPGPELRAEIQGVISVRVQIGADGRVKAFEPVGKGSAGFFDATRRQALNHWRFKPATRGGVPIESWKTMTVRFQMN